MLAGRITSYTDPIEEPVVVDHYRKEFKVDSWRDTSEVFSMQPHCITELRLKLKVACADRTTKDMFKKTRENLEEDTKVCFPFNSFLSTNIV